MIIRSIAAVIAFLFGAQAAQPSAPSPISAPIRDLPWAQLNFLHTTDTHGWHAGHLQEPSYGADWGDYISFAQRMHEKADKDGADLLLIDTGDRIEGNGLYDASDPKGRFTSQIFKQQDIDIICSGNHELYRQNSSEREYLETVPDFEGNYLASNLDIYDPGDGKRVPLAPRFKKFTTKNQGIRVLAFGFLFDFTGNYNNTVVQPVEDAIEEQWFQAAIRDRDVDLFLVAGHVAIRSEEYARIFKAIRDVQWDTPILFFGGHTHIRDYKKFDSKAYALESGRYMETIGFLSVNGLSSGGQQDGTVSSAKVTPTFSRRYIDNNLHSFHTHTNLNSTTFPTIRGLNVSAEISSARKSLELDSFLGCAPVNLWTNRAPYPSKDSIFTWLQDSVIPDAVRDANRSGIARLVIINTGAIRFDIFKGPFSKDNTYAVSPFSTGFQYIRDVPYRLAKRLLPILNSGGQLLEHADPQLRNYPLALRELEIFQNFRVDTEEDLDGTDRLRTVGQVALSHSPDLVPGYTTKDDAGSDGDDTLHSPLSFHRVPNCVQSLITSDEDDEINPEKVDLVYLAFLEPSILLAMKFLGEDYALNDTKAYMPGTDFTTLIAQWVQENWTGAC